LYLAVFGNAGRKIVVTLFLDGYHTGRLAKIKQWIFEAGQRRVHKCISTGPSFRFKNMPSVFIPDYVCDDSVYSGYRDTAKEEYAVCLGTMDHGKQLEELAEAFGRMSYRLLIAGRFYDKSRVKALMARAGDNIEIRDEYLSSGEYLKLLSGAVYAVLPYNEGNYSSQTSGVMQEAVFTDTIVLTHKDILEGNRVPGIGYSRYSDISDELLAAGRDDANGRRNRQILEEYKRLRNKVYSRENIAKKINKSLSD
ncbi:MAG: glycosyltransferase, partial [Lachnospiraceae bacterium]|nr:glycosyltransferase [Lachnospiraceae bacterium]